MRKIRFWNNNNKHYFARTLGTASEIIFALFFGPQTSFRLNIVLCALYTCARRPTWLQDALFSTFQDELDDGSNARTGRGGCSPRWVGTFSRCPSVRTSLFSLFLEIIVYFFFKMKYGVFSVNRIDSRLVAHKQRRGVHINYLLRVLYDIHHWSRSPRVKRDCIRTRIFVRAKLVSTYLYKIINSTKTKSFKRTRGNRCRRTYIIYNTNNTTTGP